MQSITNVHNSARVRPSCASVANAHSFAALVGPSDALVSSSKLVVTLFASVTNAVRERTQGSVMWD